MTKPYILTVEDIDQLRDDFDALVDRWRGKGFVEPQLGLNMDMLHIHNADFDLAVLLFNGWTEKQVQGLVDDVFARVKQTKKKGRRSTYGSLVSEPIVGGGIVIMRGWNNA